MTKQQEEIKTIAPRNITVNLSDADCLRLAALAGRCNTTVSNIIEEFIGNLVNGTYSSGSDERSLAQQYFERTGTSWMYDKTFITWALDNFYDTEDFASMIYDLKCCYDTINDPNSSEDDISYSKSDLGVVLPVFKEEYYNPYKEAVKDAVSLEKATEQAIAWYNQYNNLLGE